MPTSSRAGRLAEGELDGLFGELPRRFRFRSLPASVEYPYSNLALTHAGRILEFDFSRPRAWVDSERTVFPPSKCGDPARVFDVDITMTGAVSGVVTVRMDSLVVARVDVPSLALCYFC
jgi:hypothetical protein